MLNALLPGTDVAVHKHPMSNENVILLVGKMDEIICDAEGKEVERIHLDPSTGNFGCVVPADTWHTVEVFEGSVQKGEFTGFLDGKEGLCWNFFQGLWYRMLVDAKVYEIKKAWGLMKVKCKDITPEQKVELKEYLTKVYNIKF